MKKLILITTQTNLAKGLMGSWFCIWKIVFNRKISPLYSPTSPSAGTLSAILKDNNE